CSKQETKEQLDFSTPSITTNIDKVSLEDGEITEENNSAVASTPVTAGTQQSSTSPTCSGLPSPVEGPVSPADAHQSKAASLSSEEFERAKSVVLDLLGWGVTPEYLVDYTDLHLRLPANII
ncbi:hypothetical protein SERLA73DRAFT_189646, partial [Serpula lacrymans var. lacrymans S7.3]